MPVLLVLMVGVIVRGMTLPGAGAGLEFYLKPDFSRLDGDALLAAMGQAFFSLSLGMGILITYGSYLSRRESIGRAVLWVVVLDTTIALLAGLIIFPAGFSLK